MNNQKKIIVNLHRYLKDAGFITHSRTAGGVQGVDVYDPDDKLTEELDITPELICQVYTLDKYVGWGEWFLMVPQHGQAPYVVDALNVVPTIAKYIEHPCANAEGCRCGDAPPADDNALTRIMPAWTAEALADGSAASVGGDGPGNG